MQRGRYLDGAICTLARECIFKNLPYPVFPLRKKLKTNNLGGGMNRRSFLLMLLASVGSTLSLKAASGLPPMRIVRIETAYWKNRDTAPRWPKPIIS